MPMAANSPERASDTPSQSEAPSQIRANHKDSRLDQVSYYQTITSSVGISPS
jgi:hypothetical protein